MSERRFPWRTLLFVSVAVNLLVIGGVAGLLGSGARLQREDPEVVVLNIPGARALIGALPPEARGPVRQELVRTWVETRDLRRAALQARREALEIATAEPYDAARTRAAFERMRQAEFEVVLAFQNNLLDELGTLTPEQRAQVFETLRAAAPLRAGGALEREGVGALAPAMTPEEREERRAAVREGIRERIRERREERQQQRRTAPPP